MNGESLNITQDNLNKLKTLFPDIFSEGKIDWEKFKGTFTDDINFANERYVLNWAGKSDAFKVLQIPTTATLKPQSEQSINFDSTFNVFIEGENLEVLKVLQKSYYDKVKCIIIDPPYNTGNDSFIYPDSFKENKAEYEKRISDRDEEGYYMKEGLFRKNSKDSGHFHSNWLSMMYPRLFLAKNLLTEDGVIFIHIDDNEVHNLRLLMSEIFGEENFVGQLVWEKKKKGAFLSGNLTSIKEYIIIYAKSNSNFSGLIGEINSEEETYPVIKTTNTRGERLIKKGISSKFREKNYFLKAGSRISSGNMELILLSDLIIENGILKEDLKIDSNWIYSQDLLNDYADKKELYITQDLYLRRIVGEPRFKKIKDILFQIADDGSTGVSYKLSDNLFDDGWGTNEDGNAELHELLGIQNLFEFPKPSKLIAKLIYSLRDKNCTVLDFFAGSGTTAQAIFELNKADGGNRNFILVQLPELCGKDTEALKAGYEKITDISKERIRRVIKNIIQRKNYLEKALEDENTTVIEYEEKIVELKQNKPQLFETEKGSPELESIKVAIEIAKRKIEGFNNESNNIQNMDKGFKSFKLSSSNFKIWRGNEITSENLVRQLDAFTNPVKAESINDNILYELIIKAGYSLTDKVEKKGKYSSIKNGELIIALEEMNPKIIDIIIKGTPQKVITLDNLFAGNDQLKTNTVLQMKDEGIDFKTI